MAAATAWERRRDSVVMTWLQCTVLMIEYFLLLEVELLVQVSGTLVFSG